MNSLQTIEFDNRNWNKNISGTIYCSDLSIYAKRAGGRHLTAHIKQRTVAFIRTKILGEIVVAYLLGHPVYYKEIALTSEATAPPDLPSGSR